jgi:hypothetical protein
MVNSFARREAPAFASTYNAGPIHPVRHCSGKTRPHPGHFWGIVAEAGTH